MEKTKASFLNLKQEKKYVYAFQMVELHPIFG
jgi:hypothetical protein